MGPPSTGSVSRLSYTRLTFGGAALGLLAIIAIALSDLYSIKEPILPSNIEQETFNAIHQASQGQQLVQEFSTSQKSDRESSRSRKYSHLETIDLGSSGEQCLAAVDKGIVEFGEIEGGRQEIRPRPPPTAAAVGMNRWVFVCLFAGSIAALWNPLSNYGK